jgi:FkbM family methyltransferase
MSYDTLLHVRNEFIDGYSNWLWVAQDSGAWIGPSQEWSSHKAIIQKYVKGYDCIVQAGGNLGLYPMLYSRLFKTVYTFEPDPLNFHCLVNNCQYDNIVKIQAALSDSHEMMKVNRGGFSNVGAYTVSRDKSAIIPSLKLDDFDFEKLDAIHLDIENFEENALRGAVETINKHKPVLLLENGHRVEVMIEIQKLGYEVRDKSGSDTLFMPIGG